jgi:hypothetical protein
MMPENNGQDRERRISDEHVFKAQSSVARFATNPADSARHVIKVVILSRNLTILNFEPARLCKLQ